MKYCEKCGANNSDESEECSVCGANILSTNNTAHIAKEQVRKIAIGAIDFALILLAVGAIWWMYAVGFARGVLAYIPSEHWGNAERFPFPWELPYVVFAIPCAIAALAILVNGFRLLKLRESARKFLSFSTLVLIASNGAGIGSWIGMVPQDETSIIFAILGSLYLACTLGLPYLFIIYFGSSLYFALWHKEVIEVCGGAMIVDDRNAKYFKNLQFAVSIILGIIAGIIAGINVEGR